MLLGVLALLAYSKPARRLVHCRRPVLQLLHLLPTLLSKRETLLGHHKLSQVDGDTSSKTARGFQSITIRPLESSLLNQQPSIQSHSETVTTHFSSPVTSIHYL